MSHWFSDAYTARTNWSSSGYVVWDRRATSHSYPYGGTEANRSRMFWSCPAIMSQMSWTIDLPELLFPCGQYLGSLASMVRCRCLAFMSDAPLTTKLLVEHSVPNSDQVPQITVWFHVEVRSPPPRCTWQRGVGS